MPSSVDIDISLPEYIQSSNYFDDDSASSYLQQQPSVISSGSNSTHELFNFNLSQAVSILEQHLLSNEVLQGHVKGAIVSGYVFLITAGVFTNLLVSMVVVTNPRLRVAKNLFIVNLSVSDLMLCLFCMPFTLVELLHRNWNLGTFLCRGVPFVQGIAIFVSSSTVSAIAIDRQHMVIRYNFQKQLRENSNMMVYTMVLWILSLTLSLPIIFSKTVTAVSLAGMKLYERCIENWPSWHAKAVYTLLILIAQFVIPSVVLTVTHLRIKAYLNRSIRRHTTPRSLKTSERLQKELRRNSRATVVLAVMFFVFAFSWLPWNLFNLLVDFDLLSMSPEDIYLTFAICHLIAMSSCVTNPILYGWLNSNIKRELLKLKFSTLKQVLISSRASTAANGAAGCNDTHVKSSIRSTARDIETFSL